MAPTVVKDESNAMDKVVLKTPDVSRRRIRMGRGLIAGSAAS